MKFVTENLARVVAIFAAALFAGMYVFTALPRIFYPYDLDFIEDSMLLQAWQFARGLPVFAPPNADFSAHAYMPLYTWLGGLLLRITGPSFAPLRLFSFAAVLVTAALIFYIARRESKTRWLGFLCAGLYLAGFRITGQWYELVRVDSLFVALSLAGMTVAIYGEGRAERMMLSALLLALAFWTKQTALLYGVGIAFFLMLSFGKRVAWFVVPYALCVALPFWIYNSATGGWFWFHVVTVLGGDPIEAARILHFFARELGGVMAGLSLLALAVFILTLRRTRNPFAWLRAHPWLFAIAMGVMVSAIGRASVGGNLNNLMSAYTLLCLAPALALQESAHIRPTRFLTPRRIELAIVILLLLQFALAVYNPLRYIPSQAMHNAGDALIRRIAASEGNVLVMMHPYYALRAGKEPSAQVLTLWYANVRGGAPMPDDFRARMRARYYALIISDESEFETTPNVRELLDANYQLTETLTPADAPPTMTGVVTRPIAIYRPKP